MAMNPHAEQPDFDVFVDAFHTASVEVRKLAKIPLLQHSNAILQSLDTLQQQMQAVQRELQTVQHEVQAVQHEMQTFQEQLNSRFDKLEERLDVSCAIPYKSDITSFSHT